MNKSVAAHIGLLFVSCIWGTTFIIVQNAISLVEPFTFNSIRFLLAGTILVIILFCSQQQKQQSIGGGILVGLFLFAGYLFQTFGLLYTTSSKAGFLTGLSIVIIPVISFVFLRQKTGLLAVIGVIVASIGLFLLTADQAFTLNRGDVLVLFCAISFAVHILLNGYYSKQYTPLFLSTVQILSVGVLSGICAYLFEDWKRILSIDLWLNMSFLFALLLTALFATAIAFFIQTAAQTYVSPTRVAIILAMEPVFAALTGVFVAGETLTAAAIAGCALILLGMVFAELPNKPQKKAEAA
ncbi:DMT family transporter [Ectobacillus antri]|jgi:drug/metabolite transporter (DMT)-like permease|uniref:DMT family transporter n=1 Tax=Ectobacillus antri TaxID=2486280 RepID=A0ABT6H1J8_9BACI|nr:DMT family transporter [Ectobacillus antri]MDG4656167.1 DMT family transporter [Ectobacillus antri]MDG5752842.1 DMT family transporter [Ectobacillus antri]